MCHAGWVKQSPALDDVRLHALWTVTVLNVAMLIANLWRCRVEVFTPGWTSVATISSSLCSFTHSYGTGRTHRRHFLTMLITSATTFSFLRGRLSCAPPSHRGDPAKSVLVSSVTVELAISSPGRWRDQLTSRPSTASECHWGRHSEVCTPGGRRLTSETTTWISLRPRLSFGRVEDD